MSHYSVHGALASPYSVKVRAALRYHRLAYVWITEAEAVSRALAAVKVPVIPVIQRPDGSWTNDSTPFLQELATAHPERSLVPDTPILKMAALLVEDMADEFLTKPMFNERWSRPEDAEIVAQWLAFDRAPGLDRAQLEAAAQQVEIRQIGRMPMVGCTPANQAVIALFRDDIYAKLDDLAANGPFLFGSRPSVAEMAIYGQMSQLAADPTSGDVLRRSYPFASRWIALVDDAGGVDGDWSLDNLDDPWTRAFLRLAGDVYLPFLSANAAAVGAGDEEMSVVLYDTETFTQTAFKYQAKCFALLKAQWAELSGPDRARLSDIIGANAALLD